MIVLCRRKRSLHTQIESTGGRPAVLCTSTSTCIRMYIHKEIRKVASTDLD